jgi:hypothetical protein
MALVREHRDTLVALQASGLTWGAIAAALTAQGFTTADGRPLTGTHLTGLISSLRRQMKRREAKSAALLGRADLATATVPTLAPAGPRRLGLASDFDLPPEPGRPGGDAAVDEAALRRANLAKLQDLLKDQQP